MATIRSLDISICPLAVLYGSVHSSSRWKNTKKSL